MLSASWVLVAVCNVQIHVSVYVPNNSDIPHERSVLVVITPSPIVVQSIVINPSVCVCVCVCLSVGEHISGTAGPIVIKFCVQIPCGHGSIFLWRRCATLCTSGFMDDVTFGCSGPYGVAWPAWADTNPHLRARPGHSLMSMNACFSNDIYANRLTYIID